MDTLSYLGQGFGIALSPYNLVTALSGTLIGTVVGLLPGLGPINGVALLIPIAFALGLPPESALILLAAVSWSVYFALQKHYAHRYSPLTMACYMVWAGTLMLCVNLPGLPAAVVQAPFAENVAVVVLGIFPSALAYLAWGYVLKHVEVSRASVHAYNTEAEIDAMIAALSRLPRV